jgi:hypothetical protein
MKYEKPQIRDLGEIGEHTFITPGGDNKGTTGFDPFGELSDHSSSGS